MSAWLFVWMWWVLNTVSFAHPVQGDILTALRILAAALMLPGSVPMKLICMSAVVQAITAAFVVTGLITFRNIHVVRLSSTARLGVHEPLKVSGRCLGEMRPANQ